MLYNNHEYPPRVTLDSDGFYRWSVELDKKQRNEQFAMMVTVCCIIASVILGAMAFVSINTRFFKDIMLSGLGLIGGMVLLPIVIWKLMDRLPPNTVMRFEMNDEYVKHVGNSGKDSGWAAFQSIRKIVVKRSIHMIWVKSAFTGVQVFVPNEDYRFVLQYIQDKTNGKAETLYP
ncbi:MAG: hypothetical protein IK099_14525 [Clostridia bacterium]|nr:hypothetical protein [Clostridia bacterium]